MTKTVCLVPLRGGSKGIPFKNIRVLNGKPLCAYVLEAASKSIAIDKIYVSTDCLQIAEVVSNLCLDITIIDRPTELAQDESTTEEVMLHFAEKVDFKNIITVQATSPMLTSKDIDDAFNFFEEKGFDSIVTGCRVNRFLWSDDGLPLNYNPSKRPTRQNFKGSIMENGSFYITKRKILIEDRCRLGGKIGIFEMTSDTIVEIDEFKDWTLVESFLSNKENKK